MSYQTKLSRLSLSQLNEIIDKAGFLTYSGTCCPNNCRIDRRKNTPKCNALSEKIKVASFSIHNGEEPPVSGKNGAGNIFFSGCTMGCVYCQNYPFSQLNNGKEYSIDEFAQKILDLQQKGVHNINLVTADQYLLAILKSISLIKSDIKIPILYNCSGYHNIELLQIVDDIADVYLYDVKYISDESGFRYSERNNYSEKSFNGLEYLLKRNPELVFEDELLKRGVVVRHLILPGEVDQSIDIISKIEQYAKSYDFRFSLMSQYFPAWKVLESNQFKNINRKISEEEYKTVVSFLHNTNLEGWTQDLVGQGGC